MVIIADSYHHQGGLRAILRVFGGFATGVNSEATCRVAAGALANVAMAEANQLQILQVSLFFIFV